MSKIRRVHNRNILFCCSVLITIGFIFIFSASSISADQNYQDMFYFAKRQGIALSIGLVTGVLIYRAPLATLSRMVLPLFIFTTLLLLATHIAPLNRTVNGASRWLKIGAFSFQPAELAKLSIIIFVARNLTRPSFSGLHNLRGLLSSCTPLAIIAPLLMLQPDFGSCLLIFLVVFAMLFTGGLSFRYVVMSLSLGVCAIATAILLAPYRMARIVTFLDPWQTLQTSGFQIVQSYLGFYNGGLAGLGIGQSRQKLFFLPEAHTDFIFSVIGEELGLLGVALVIGLFAFLIYQGLQITRSQVENFQKMLAFGLTCLIAVQGSINMGVSVGLLPTKGMPLPFISYGSSSLLVFIWVVAILAKLNSDADKTHDHKKTH